KEVEIVLEEAEPRPPAADKLAVKESPIPGLRWSKAPENTKAESSAIGKPPALKGVTTSLADAFYIQLGAYSDLRLAQALKDSFLAIYPVTLYESGKPEKPLYRVLIGPVNQDESGSLLYNFRAKGFKDAFIRAGD
ncbi:MAG: SPOR domain-containing protein, partial [Spirochaetota bacterium]